MMLLRLLFFASRAHTFLPSSLVGMLEIGKDTRFNEKSSLSSHRLLFAKKEVDALINMKIPHIRLNTFAYDKTVGTFTSGVAVLSLPRLLNSELPLTFREMNNNFRLLSFSIHFFLRNRHSEHMWFLFEYVFIAASSHT
jgi:hypothetical protein